MLNCLSFIFFPGLVAHRETLAYLDLITERLQNLSKQTVFIVYLDVKTWGIDVVPLLDCH